MARVPRLRRPSRSRAFTLIEILVVLFILGTVIAMAASLSRAVTASQQRSLTTTRLATVDAALVQFVMQQKRLPCPADGTLASASANAGTEMARDTANGCNTQQNGVVPWRALGLSEGDMIDGWGRRMTYRVGPKLTADSGMDMSWCDPAGTGGGGGNNACNTACTSTALNNCTPPNTFLAGKGLQVQNAGGIVVMNPNGNPPTGAAYVVVSGGFTGGGVYITSGNLVASTVVDGNQERHNYANLNYGGGSYYVDDVENDNSGATHFDDVLSRPSIMAVVSKASLAPRSH